jgi:hypothetical protein
MRSLRGATRPAARESATPASALDAKHVGAGVAAAGDAARVRDEIEVLERLGLHELRLRWRNRWGRLAPAHLTRGVLFRLMAYRIQVDAFGDIDRQTAMALDRMAKQDAALSASDAVATIGTSPPSIVPASKRRRSASPRILKPGAVMMREWQGRTERVMVLEQGFAWNGKTFTSLSAVAFAITGVKWNGHRFFFGADGQARSGKGGNADGAENAKDDRDSGGKAPAQRSSLTVELAP